MKKTQMPETDPCTANLNEPSFQNAVEQKKKKKNQPGTQILNEYLFSRYMHEH